MVSNAPSGTKIHLCSRSCFSKGMPFSTKASLAAEPQGPVFLFHHKGFARSHTQPLFPPLIHLQYHRGVPDHSALATEMLPLQQGPAFLFWTYAMMAVWGVAFPGMEYTIPCTPDIESPSPRWKVEDSVVFFFYFEGIFLHILTVEYLKIVSNIPDHWDWLRFVFGCQAHGFFVKVPRMLTPVTHRWVVSFTW